MAGQQTVAIVSQQPSQGLQGKFKCKTCNMTCTTRYALQKHQKTHTENYTQCPHCNNTYTKRGLKTHTTKKHATRNHIDDIIDDVVARQRDNIVPASKQIDDVINDVIAKVCGTRCQLANDVDDVFDGRRDNIVPAPNHIDDVIDDVIARVRTPPTEEVCVIPKSSVPHIHIEVQRELDGATETTNPLLSEEAIPQHAVESPKPVKVLSYTNPLEETQVGKGIEVQSLPHIDPTQDYQGGFTCEICSRTFSRKK